MPPKQTQTSANAFPVTTEATRFFNDMFGSPQHRHRSPLPIYFGVWDKHLDMPVLEISFHAVELSMALDEDGLPLLHWRISAITEIEPVEGTTEYKGSCVAMEMTSENPRRPTALTIIKTTPYPWTKGAHTYKRLAMGPNGVGVTVKTLVRLLLKDWEVHRFELVNRVSGCLHWSTTVIQRLEREGILQEGAIALCKEIVDAARRSGIVGVPKNRRGRFFNPDLESIPLAV